MTIPRVLLEAKLMAPTWYKIRIRETLEPDWMEWFEGMEITRGKSGETILSGSVKDQAALHGLLLRIRNLNLTLLSVNPAARQKHKEKGK